MSSQTAWVVVIILAIIVAAVGAYVIFAPAPVSNSVATTTPNAATTTNTNTGNQTVSQPLSARVTVTAPKPNATVGKTFTVAGQAPGPWFFEASFPIQVRDPDGNILANSYGQAQGEWMTTDLVTFTGAVTITGSYSGPATLILMRDNPSGMPENDDSVSYEIVIQ